MTAHALTYAVPVERARAADVRATLRRLAADRGAAAGLFDTGSVHFASITLFDAPDAADPMLACAGDLPALLVFEQYVDAPRGAAGTTGYAAALAARDPAALHALLVHCRGYDGAATPADIATCLERHAVRPSVHFAGNPRADCARVREEQALRATLDASLAARWHALPRHVPRTAATLHAVAWSVAGDGIDAPHVRPPRLAALRRGLRLLLTLDVLAALATVALPLLLVGLALLRRQERLDPSANPDDLDPEHVERLTACEDLGGQNHLASVIVVKPGSLRQTALRTALRVVGLVAAAAPEGTLSGITSIHHAQWTLLDGGRRLLFLTNYDASWGSYLDDFVRFAARGLTAIWSNTVGFPPTRFLVCDGARDGRAFKAYVRRQQTAASLRYSAYPALTVRQVAANCRLREGLARRPLTKAGLSAWGHLC